MMRNAWKRLLFVPLLLAAALTGCDAPNRPSLYPSQPEPLLGSLLGGTTAQYTLVREPLLSPVSQILSTSGLIGINGGSITLLGHTLTVPSGAVTQPTLFVLSILPTGYVEVELEASVSSLLGTVLNVGGQGFLKPVPVTLTYSRATNVSDPRKLKIVHLKGLLGYKEMVVLPTRVDLEKKTVTADLEHFSRYAIAIP